MIGPWTPYMAWIKVGAAVLVCGLFYGWGYHTAKLAGSLALETERLAIANDARAQIEAAQQHAYEADERLRKALDTPKAAPAIDEVVHANPSRCFIPKPVGDRVRQAIREANQAAAAR